MQGKALLYTSISSRVFLYTCTYVPMYVFVTQSNLKIFPFSFYNKEFFYWHLNRLHAGKISEIKRIIKCKQQKENLNSLNQNTTSTINKLF